MQARSNQAASAGQYAVRPFRIPQTRAELLELKYSERLWMEVNFPVKVKRLLEGES